MSLAWTTIAVVLLILPGAGFFLGLYANERRSREVIKSSALGDLGQALFFAIVIHLLFFLMSWLSGLDAAFFFKPLADYANTPSPILYEQIAPRLLAALVYIVVASVAGYVLGFVLAWLSFILPPLRGLATHPWAYDLSKYTKNKGALVSAYVMTTTTENNRTLMYTGYLSDYFLDENGCFSYIVLRGAARFYMKFDGEIPTPTDPQPLYAGSTSDRIWEHLFISGENIANVLFDTVQRELDKTRTGQKALDEALARHVNAPGMLP